MPNFLEKILVWSVALVAKFGYGGIFLTMALESAAIPIPSEVVLPFGGFLASGGQLNIWLVVAVATLANLAGSILIYLIGWHGGRALLDRYGKYIFIHQKEVSRMDHWLARHGSKAVFFSRLLPGVRTFSSLVIGAGRVRFSKFFFYTLFGSFLWNLPLAYAGFATGQNWDTLRPYFKKFELAIAVVLLTLIASFIYRHLKKNK